MHMLQGKRGIYSWDNSAPFAYGRASVLFEGKDNTGSPVIIKAFRTSSGGSQEVSYSAFFNEVEAQLALKHPNILSVLDYGNPPLEDLGPFIVLPKCGGGNLRALMRRTDFIPLSRSVDILAQIAAAVDFAHRHGIVHGDIKPENILFSADMTQTFLADFGAAKFSPPQENLTTQQGSGREAGTAAYMSPEQLSEGVQSARSDVYSLAVVAFELLTGKLPFDSTAPLYRQMHAKVSGNLLDPGDINPLLSPQVREALLAGLAKEPVNRPKAAMDFTDLLTGSTTSAVQSKSTTTSGFWESLDAKNKVALITAAIAALSGIAATIIKIVPDLLKKH